MRRSATVHTCGNNKLILLSTLESPLRCAQYRYQLGMHVAGSLLPGGKRARTGSEDRLHELLVEVHVVAFGRRAHDKLHKLLAPQAARKKKVSRSCSYTRLQPPQTLLASALHMCNAQQLSSCYVCSGLGRESPRSQSSGACCITVERCRLRRQPASCCCTTERKCWAAVPGMCAGEEPASC